jgi:transcription elongation factor GreA-like protein
MCEILRPEEVIWNHFLKWSFVMLITLCIEGWIDLFCKLFCYIRWKKNKWYVVKKIKPEKMICTCTVNQLLLAATLFCNS